MLGERLFKDKKECMKNMICYRFSFAVKLVLSKSGIHHLMKNFMERKLLNGNNLSLLPIGYFYSNYKK